MFEKVYKSAVESISSEEIVVDLVLSSSELHVRLASLFSFI